ncbi:MAG: LLM class flavin-dependent oxidoreductase [Chloroflexi bacterium]|nr:LLM class flavin-dependent oxidoreductase [Chloroflexota bacterium]
MPDLGLVLYHGFQSGGELASYGRLADDLGYHSLWTTERYQHEETFATLGYLAASTSRLRLGVAVANAYTRHPGLLAMASATLDRVSGGRFILCMGTSDKPVVEEKLGVPYGDARATLEQAVRSIRGLLAGERVESKAGGLRFGPTKLAVTPVQQPLPIYVAAVGPKALRLAGAIGDGVMLNSYTPTAYVRWAIGEVGEGARAVGRDPARIPVACMLTVRMTNDAGGIRASLKERIVRLLAESHTGEVLVHSCGYDPSLLPRLREAERQGKRREAARFISDAMVDEFWVLGNAGRIRERIAEYRAAGVTLPLLLPRLEDYEAVARAVQP